MHFLIQAGSALGKLATANKPTYQRHQLEQTLLYQLVQRATQRFSNTRPQRVARSQTMRGRSSPTFSSAGDWSMVFSGYAAKAAVITSAGRGKGSKQANKEGVDRSFAERHMAMTWAQRLKRVFNIDIETCEKCQGPVRIIACVKDPVVIKKILNHLASKETSAE